MADPTVTEARLVVEPEPITGFSGPDAPPVGVIRSCVHCGFCLPACPTYLLTGRERSSPRGRIALIKSVSEGTLDLFDPTFQEEMYFCLNCRACEAACPSGVKYGELVETARVQIETHVRRPIKVRAARTIALRGAFASPRRFRLLSTGLKLYQRSGLRTIARKSGAIRAFGLEQQEAMLPELSDAFLRAGREYWPAQGIRRGTVALLAGCVMRTAYADVHRATARVLARNGFDVDVPDGQGCCGALSVHSGDLEGGRTLARSNIEVLGRRDYDAVVVNSAGCGAAMKEYDFLLRDDPAYAEKARMFSAKVRDVTEFLAAEGLSVAPGRIETTVTYQEPCHLVHAQRVAAQPRSLLNAIPGVRLVEMAESSLCCGSAGIYNLLQPETSSALLERKLDNALRTGTRTIVSANPGCMLQLIAGLRQRGQDVEVVHIMTLLDRAYAALDAEG
ncbi:MAG TPA: heterodisulfide reductase-related iron-sulfur binding cluster [Thermomicrobiales bacterium]|nr:heterodisulfide reductase-related iron-sulfur binding cluster [Thermomicrobiales bacterium]